jgi:malate synthase
MEDAATAEISRTQLWQCIHHPEAKLDDGRPVTKELCQRLFQEQMDKLREKVGEERFAAGHFEQARSIIEQISYEDECKEFMTLAGYDHLD